MKVTLQTTLNAGFIKQNRKFHYILRALGAATPKSAWNSALPINPNQVSYLA
jgi:hypothetical protein